MKFFRLIFLFLILGDTSDLLHSGMTNNNVVTLSWLLAQDLPQAYIFTERPSTFNHKATFINDKKYVIHDYSPDKNGDSRHLKAMRACPVAGSKFPILVTRDINPLIREVSILQDCATTCMRWCSGVYSYCAGL